MDFRVYFLLTINICLSIVVYRFLQKSVSELCEVDSCPYCYGLDCCALISNGSYLEASSFTDLFFNYLSMKNVYFVNVGGERVVLKKLASSDELQLLDDSAVLKDKRNYSAKVFEFLARSDGISDFKTCSSETAEKFLSDLLKLKPPEVSEELFYKYTWATLRVNVEPLILKLLQADDYAWPVPKYLGACGRAVLVEFCGGNLNGFAVNPWNDRAYLSLQILQAARDFTDRHKHYRFYLTDVSPDNIAVDGDLKVSFVDLGNVVMGVKTESDAECVHRSENFENESGLTYSEEEICGGCLSDHNIYSVCKHLLWEKAPWPMMEGGLLHSPPSEIVKKYERLFQLIEFCVEPNYNQNRFQISLEITGTLNEILSQT